MKRLKLGIIWILFLFIAVSCSKDSIRGFVNKEFKSGDAKFFGDRIVTSKDGSLCLLDFSGKITNHYADVPSAWVDGLFEDKVIILGNWNNEINILQLDKEMNKLQEYNVLHSDNLHIDPSICKIENVYFVTATEIVGNINNSDPKAENGTYTVHFLRSDNLKDWEPVSDIISVSSNIEDIDLVYHKGRIYVCYEKEIVDKGRSEINLKYSDDLGISWSDEVNLLPADCDHEPVCFIPEEDGFRLLYSSDKENPGKSYSGGRIYYAEFDQKYQLIVKDMKIETKTNEGLLWYDYAEYDDGDYYLFAGDYLNTNDLILEINKNS